MRAVRRDKQSHGGAPGRLNSALRASAFDGRESG
jgi:hypothetical protein